MMAAEGAKELANLTTDSAWGQIIGSRKSQQDRAAIVSWPNGFSLHILADGMGGHVGGAEASQLVVSTFRESFVASEKEEIKDRFLEGLSAANLAVYEYVKQNPEMEGMGSTFLALIFDGNAVQWISVGDSPLWLYRQGKLSRLNENHSMAEELSKQVEQGLISAEEAATSPERSQLLEAVLGRDIKLVDLPDETFSVEAGDIFILASDGVETCSVEELQSLLAAEQGNSLSDAEKLVEIILQKVTEHQRPSQDNSTLNIIRILGDQAHVQTLRGKNNNETPTDSDNADEHNDENADNESMGDEN
ncbi:MAG: hypothetical protein CMP91_10105 [Gammaproteobacteria bacterium]|nr:hypothetical protein [Gammaproteobacteria bacterium]|tara:strand:- start:82771 stop:83685 length:915 start_codon:yes stop_codon:yes gene_type:complete